MLLSRDLDTESWNALAQREEGRELPFESITRMNSPSLSFGAADREAPQFRALDESAMMALRVVRINAGFALVQRASALPLLRWNDGSAAFVSERIGEGALMLLATSPERASGNLGTSPSFPSLTSSILRSASNAREPLSRTVGEAVRLNVALDTDVKVTSLEGHVSATKARELISHPPAYFSEPGIYRLEFAGAEKFMAFNAPVVESKRALATADDLKRFFYAGKTEEIKTASVSSQREATERSGSTWRYFLIAAFLLMIAELFVAMRQRRITAPEITNERSG